MDKKAQINSKLNLGYPRMTEQINILWRKPQTTLQLG